MTSYLTIIITVICAHGAYDLVSFICKSKLWKLRDEFVDEYLLSSWPALDHAPEERNHVLRLVGEIERCAIHKPIRSFIAFKFKKLACYNEAYRIVNEVIDRVEGRGL